jgi:hypothetical protein
MLTVHDQFTHQMRNSLKTTAMGLGLVRLLQDAGQIEEARTTLYSLENGFQDVAEESDKPQQALRLSEWEHVHPRPIGVLNQIPFSSSPDHKYPKPKPNFSNLIGVWPQEFSVGTS